MFKSIYWRILMLLMLTLVTPFSYAQFVAVGQGFTFNQSIGMLISVSEDGRIWQDVEPDTNPSDSLFNVVYANGRWLALGISDNISFLMTSTDGYSWQRERPNRGSIMRLAYGNGKFVMVGNIDNQVTGNNIPVIQTSTDGITWTFKMIIAKPRQSTFSAVAYGNGKWIAVGSYGLAYVSTDNAVSWQPMSTFEQSQNNLYAIAYANNTWMVSGEQTTEEHNNDDTIIYTSSDGINWTPGTDLGGANISNLIYGNGIWMITGNDYLVTSSNNGKDWTSYAPSIFNSKSLYDAVYNQNTWYLSTDGSIFTSSDTQNWQEIKMSGAQDPMYYAIASSN